MSQLNLQVVNPLIEDFGLEGIYRNDIWDVSQLDIYKNSTEDTIKKFEKRGHLIDNNFYFDTCQNEALRWELKYFFYIYSKKDIKLTTFNEYYLNVKQIIKYVNIHSLNANSFTDVDVDNFTFWLTSNGFSAKYESSTKILEQMEKIKTQCHSKYIKTLQIIISNLHAYETRNLSPYELDVWEISKLIPDYPDDAKIKKFIFSGILQERIKNAAKEYVHYRMNSISASAITGTIVVINIFSRWLNETYPEIDSLEELNRTIMEDFIAHLKLEVEIKSRTFSSWMGSLNVFFSYCMLLNIDFAPTTTLLTSADYKTKTEYTVNPYTDEEIQLMVSNINNLPKQIARIFFVHLHVGMRLSELCRLKINQLSGEAGKYKLLIVQSKTSKGNIVPVHDRVARAII